MWSRGDDEGGREAGRGKSERWEESGRLSGEGKGWSKAGRKRGK